MPKLAFTKRYDTGSLADKETFQKEWTSPKDLIIHRIFIKSVDGIELKKSLFWLKVGDDVYTEDDIPASIWGPDILVSPVIDINFSKAKTLNFIFKNLEGATKQVYITFELYEP